MSQSVFKDAINLQNTSDFWDRIVAIRHEYNSELKMKPEISLGRYANSSNDEFFAEAFANGMLSDKPSPYGLKVVELVDKTFRR